MTDGLRNILYYHMILGFLAGFTLLLSGISIEYWQLLQELPVTPYATTMIYSGISLLITSSIVGIILKK